MCIKPPHRSFNTNVATGDNDPRIWRVLPKFCSIAQTTGNGKPLSQRVMNRNFFRFDNTYKDVSPRQLYAENIQEIVHKFVRDGRNGTIFTHGFHTDDPSLYKMIHLAAKDLFCHIENDHSNEYLVRVSFVAIHDENIIDLSQSQNGNKNIIESDDDDESSGQGIYVHSNEVIVNHQDLIPKIFLQGKNRISKSKMLFANRSTTYPHSVFKITLEKRNTTNCYDQKQSNNSYISGCKQGIVLTSALTFVNLGKSEKYTCLRSDESKLKQDIIIDQR